MTKISREWYLIQWSEADKKWRSDHASRKQKRYNSGIDIFIGLAALFVAMALIVAWAELIN